MCIVYATGRPGRFEFFTAEAGGQTSEGSSIFAACDGDRVEERLEPGDFEQMTDGEYYELRALVRELRACPHIGRGCPARGGWPYRLWRVGHRP